MLRRQAMRDVSRVWVYYALFILLAAPLELHLYFWGGIGTHDHALMVRPLSEALIYFYAVILAMEAAFRVAHNPEVFRGKSRTMYINFGCLAVALLFVVHYLNVLQPEIRAGHDVEGTWPLQIVATVIAIGVSITTYISIHRWKKDEATE
jgi:hypothetical protein